MQCDKNSRKSMGETQIKSNLDYHQNLALWGFLPY